MAEFISPGEVVERTGFTMDTLRYYERAGLLDPVERGPGGRRRYAEHDVARLGILNCLRETGMSVLDMRRFAELTRGGDETVPDRIELLAEHDAEIENRIARLREQQTHIRRKLDGYQAMVADR